MDTLAYTSEQEILQTVAGLVREVIGEGWADELEIGPETSFSEDLELESIELVALAEKMQARYGEGVDFVGWLADKDLDAIIGLTVGEVVEFIAACR